MYILKEGYLLLFSDRALNYQINQLDAPNYFLSQNGNKKTINRSPEMSATSPLYAFHITIANKNSCWHEFCVPLFRSPRSIVMVIGDE